METLENLKNDYAKEQGYEEWEHLTNDMQPHSNMYLEQAMNEICIRAQKEALEKAAENAETKTEEYYVGKIQGHIGLTASRIIIDRNSITTPENLIL